MSDPMTAILAHRGNTEAAPENTLAAFRDVLPSAADGVEFDVQATRDGVPVVIHDEWLERVTGVRAYLQHLDWEEVRRLDAGAWKDAAYAGERIPSLAEVLDVLMGSALTVNIEVKTQVFPYPGLPEAICREVRERKMAGRTIFSSFNHNTLLELARLEPEIPRGALLSSHLVSPWDYAAAHGFQALHLEYHACTRQIVDECHRRGLAVRVYTPISEKDLSRTMEMGVDAVVTDLPSRAVSIRGQP